jgi:hypothetical protein
MLSVTRTSIFGVLAALASLPAAGQTPVPPTSIFGLYGQSTPGHDSIRITKKPDG